VRGPYRRRRVQRPPRMHRFRPAETLGDELPVTRLSVSEYEAIRLADLLGLEHREAAEHMAISRPTFTRLIEKARHKVAQALVEGHELVIEGGLFDYVETLYRCPQCGEISPRPVHQGKRARHGCRSSRWEDLAERFPPDSTERSGHGHARERQR